MAAVLAATALVACGDDRAPRREARTATAATEATAATVPPVGATHACEHPPDGQRIGSVNDAFVHSNGIWAVLAADHGARTPVLLGTADNGATWTYHCVDHEASGESVFFVDDRHGWAVVAGNETSPSLLLRTVDGGTTWGKAQLPDHEATLHDVTFISAHEGWAVGERAGAAVVLHSTDGGASWSQLAAPPRQAAAHHVRFGSRTHGWVFDVDGNVAATTNGGTTWTTHDVDRAPMTLTDAAFADERTGWAVGHRNADPRRGVVWSTTDGGATWAERVTFGHPVNDIALRGAREVRASGGPPGTVETSRDGGATWTAQPALAAFSAVWSVDDATVWGYADTEDRAGCLYSAIGERGEPGIWTAHVLFNTPGCRATHA